MNSRQYGLKKTVWMKRMPLFIEVFVQKLMVEHLPKYFPLVSVPSVCFHLLSVESLFNKSLSHNFSIIFFGQNLSNDPLVTVSDLSLHILKCLFTNLFI